MKAQEDARALRAILKKWRDSTLNERQLVLDKGVCALEIATVLSSLLGNGSDADMNVGC